VSTLLIDAKFCIHYEWREKMAKYQVVMSAGPTPGKVFDVIGPNVTIGRDLNAEIVINIPEVSRRHARFRLESGVYLLEDLGSTNGTFVNGRRLTAPHLMRSGDTIMLGEAVTLNFAGGQFDPNATVVSSSSQSATMIAQDAMNLPPDDPARMYAQDYSAIPLAPPPIAPAAFSGQIPAGPMDFGNEMPVEEPKNRTWLWAIVGCLVVLLCACVAGALLFDMMDMYCQEPFDSLFSFLYTCP
jgi:predicted component of type VI protein secretion system